MTSHPSHCRMETVRAAWRYRVDTEIPDDRWSTLCVQLNRHHHRFLGAHHL